MAYHPVYDVSRASMQAQVRRTAYVENCPQKHFQYSNIYISTRACGLALLCMAYTVLTTALLSV